MLFAGGLLATTLYWPGVAGAATTPRWAALAMIVPWLLRDGVKITPAHSWGIAFLAVAALSFLWTPVPLDTINQAFFALIWVAVFCLGFQTQNLRLFYIGCGVGLSVSSAIAIGQWFGWQPLPPLYYGKPFGLFVNGNYMAEAAALILIAALSERIWWLIPPLVPAVVLPHASGASVAVGAALVAYFWSRARMLSWAIVVGIAGAAVWFAVHLDVPATTDRLLIWRSTWDGLTVLGHGFGSFWSTYPAFDLRPNPADFPEYAHNEWLHIAFELGIPGLIAALGFCALLLGPLDTPRLILLTLFVEMCFAFPLHLPATAAIGFLVAGHAVRLRYLRRSVLFDRRTALGVGLGAHPLAPRFDVVSDSGGAGVSFRSSFSRGATAAIGP